ncbi:hypothetical protein HY29_07140 [Hyphomonas beringensis]|uniref:Lipoprotein n=1 Tax=Hyphomonas beringensis TaxID=1280946 RepID=A0A062TRR4_9PROT|nr:hypothetical protein [Hyphomonas beringensis]KCZ50531.1 hypothetical protein HY29_07140 [Hyphomonas beringensis]
MRGAVLCLAALLTGCAASPVGAGDVVRSQALLLQPGGEATLRVDCPPGQMPVSARTEAGDAFIITESRPAEPGVWWVTYANPADSTAEADVSIILTCRKIGDG